jgi:hypothetical protein
VGYGSHRDSKPLGREFDSPARCLLQLDSFHRGCSNTFEEGRDGHTWRQVLKPIRSNKPNGNLVALVVTGVGIATMTAAKLAGGTTYTSRGRNLKREALVVEQVEGSRKAT